jgi:hypothetical protein
VISHFHDDHFGSWYPSAPLSADRKFALSGITGVASLIRLSCLVTRDYNYPRPILSVLQTISDTHYVKTWENYLSFVKDEKDKGMITQFLKLAAGPSSHLYTRQRNTPAFIYRM